MNNQEIVKETIRISKNGIAINILIAEGKQGNYFVIVSPSANVSGYGRTKKQAKESFTENIKIFCHDLMALSKNEIEKELRNLGFKKEFLHNKNFSKSFVDENGMLQNFDEGTVEKKMYEETSTCA